jgi:hypothetical protein
MTAVLVVGGGVAGCELAWGLARADVPTLLLTTTLDTLYALPADAWPARPPPTRCGRGRRRGGRRRGLQRAGPLRRAAKRELEREPQLRVLQSNATALWRSDDGAAVLGVRSWEGPARRAATTVLAVGSFLGARLTLGASVEGAGRLSEMAYDDLRDDLRGAGVGSAGARSAWRRRAHAALPGGARRGRPDRVGVARGRRPRRWRARAAPPLARAVVARRRHRRRGLEAAAAAGRDLARHLALVHRGDGPGC